MIQLDMLKAYDEVQITSAADGSNVALKILVVDGDVYCMVHEESEEDKWIAKLCGSVTSLEDDYAYEDLQPVLEVGRFIYLVNILPNAKFVSLSTNIKEISVIRDSEPFYVRR